jgi:hypothetical protein
MSILRLIPASGPEVEVTDERAVVGRDASCDVVVNDVSVSRKHARLERVGSSWAVIDQRSANGTFLDGQRVSESMLAEGQELRFGAINYRVEFVTDTGATVLLQAPSSTSATVVQAPPRPRPAPVPAPVPVPAPAPVPPPPAPVVHAPAAAPPVSYAPPPEPAPSGRGPLFWVGLLVVGMLLLAVAGIGAVVGVAWFSTKGAVEAAEGQVAAIRAGDVDGAYQRTAARYRSAHSSAAFAAFVARHPGLKDNTGVRFGERSVDNGKARLSGTLTHPGGTEEVVYELDKEDDAWRVSGLVVDGDAGAAAAADPAGPVLELIGVKKVPQQGQTVAVKIDVRVTGFALRPEGQLFAVDLAQDLETIGPDGARMDELSRVGLQNFKQTSATRDNATATFNTSLTFARPEPGRYKAIIGIRDLVGNTAGRLEVPFELP